jgi:hypothetical protein
MGIDIYGFLPESKEPSSELVDETDETDETDDSQTEEKDRLFILHKSNGGWWEFKRELGRHTVHKLNIPVEAKMKLQHDIRCSIRAQEEYPLLKSLLEKHVATLQGELANFEKTFSARMFINHYIEKEMLKEVSDGKDVLMGIKLLLVEQTEDVVWSIDEVRQVYVFLFQMQDVIWNGETHKWNFKHLFDGLKDSVEKGYSVTIS